MISHWLWSKYILSIAVSGANINEMLRNESSSLKSFRILCSHSLKGAGDMRRIFFSTSILRMFRMIFFIWRTCLNAPYSLLRSSYGICLLFVSCFSGVQIKVKGVRSSWLILINAFTFSLQMVRSCSLYFRFRCWSWARMTQIMERIMMTAHIRMNQDCCHHGGRTVNFSNVNSELQFPSFWVH